MFSSDSYVYMSHWLIGEANEPSLAHLTLVSYYDLSLQSFVLGCLLYTLDSYPSMESYPSRNQTPPWVMILGTLYSGRIQTPLSGFQIKYVQFQLTIFSRKLTPSPTPYSLIQSMTSTSSCSHRLVISISERSLKNCPSHFTIPKATKIMISADPGHDYYRQPSRTNIFPFLSRSQHHLQSYPEKSKSCSHCSTSKSLLDFYHPKQ